jgi:GntR family transcriptional regulator/MocR family aminotransferase
MAVEFNISRNTVSLAFEQLILEGYLEGKTGSGTYVANHLPEKLLQSRSVSLQTKYSSSSDQENIHQNFGLSEELLKRNKTCEQIVPFQTAIPAFDIFPFPAWTKIAMQVYRNMNQLQLGYDDAAGHWPLREAIAGYLRTARAVKCEADNILIITGSQQGLNLAAKVLMKPGDKAWIEDPGYHGARAALLIAGADLCPVPVGTMPLPKRLQLLEWAKNHNMWILEDDYDSEFRYVGRPLASLQGLDNANRVIYLGTFSKVLFPGLRIAYLVLPTPQLMDAFTSAKAMADRQNPIVEQAILTAFINEGHFSRHLRKMRVLYQQRQEILIRATKNNLSGLMEIEPSQAGMHAVGWLSEKTNERAVSEKAAEYGVIVHPISDYTIEHFTSPGILLGYTSFDEKLINESIELLAKALKS